MWVCLCVCLYGWETCSSVLNEQFTSTSQCCDHVKEFKYATQYYLTERLISGQMTDILLKAKKFRINKCLLSTLSFEILLPCFITAANYTLNSGANQLAVPPSASIESDHIYIHYIHGFCKQVKTETVAFNVRTIKAQSALWRLSFFAFGVPTRWGCLLWPVLRVLLLYWQWWAACATHRLLQLCELAWWPLSPLKWPAKFWLHLHTVHMAFMVHITAQTNDYLLWS